MSDKRKEEEDVDELSDSDFSDDEDQPGAAASDPELHREVGDDDDDDDEDDVEFVCAPAPQATFSLKGGSSAFSNRSQSIFDCLDSVPQKTTTTTTNTSSSSSLPTENMADGGPAAVSPAKPECPSLKRLMPPPADPAPPPAKRGVPDYLVHPERWTCYNLEDVAETSEEDNREAARNFLSGLQQQQRRRQERPPEPPCDLGQKMVFSRPNRALKDPAADHSADSRGEKKRTYLSHLEDEEEQKTESKAVGQRSHGGTREEEEEEEEEEEGMDVRRGARRPEEEKIDPRGRGDQAEEEVKPGFASFRKFKKKNYRRSSAEQE